MKLRFDPAALVRLVLLGTGIWLVILLGGMVKEGCLHPSTLLLLLFFGSLAGILIKMFRLPLYMFFGLHRLGLRLTGNILKRLDENAPGREFFLYHHSYFLFELGHFEEALVTLETIELSRVPDALRLMISQNKAFLLLVLFRANEALAILSSEPLDEHYPDKMRAGYLAYAAEAHAQLQIRLEPALDLAESSFSLDASPKTALILGHILWKMQHFKEAEAWLSWGIRRFIRRKSYFKSYGWLLRAGIFRESGESRAAEESLRKALLSAPSAECRTLYSAFWEASSPKRKRRQS